MKTTVNNKPYQVGEIVYANYGYSMYKFVVYALAEDGVALMKNSSGTIIASNDGWRTFYRTGIIKKWWEFWK